MFFLLDFKKVSSHKRSLKYAQTAISANVHKTLRWCEERAHFQNHHYRLLDLLKFGWLINLLKQLVGLSASCPLCFIKK